ISSNPHNKQIAQPECRESEWVQCSTECQELGCSECNSESKSSEYWKSEWINCIPDLVEIEEVNENCILMANLQQASTLGTQTDKAPVYDSDGSAEVHDYKNCYDNEIFNMFTQEE
nr:hypothetical protein [Tanacetum cinerariifolium]